MAQNLCQAWSLVGPNSFGNGAEDDEGAVSVSHRRIAGQTKRGLTGTVRCLLDEHEKPAITEEVMAGFFWAQPYLLSGKP